jgi:hypothetical protein
MTDEDQWASSNFSLEAITYDFMHIKLLGEASEAANKMALKEKVLEVKIWRWGARYHIHIPRGWIHVKGSPCFIAKLSCHPILTSNNFGRGVLF